MKFILVFLFFSITLALGCRNANNSTIHDLRVNEIIKKEGKYYSKEKNLLLSIEIRNRLVFFNVYDSSNRLLETNEEYHASDYQKWFFVLDSAGRIWFESSDIGTYIVMKKSGNSYALYGLNPNDVYLDSMPRAVLDQISPHMRHLYKRVEM